MIQYDGSAYMGWQRVNNGKATKFSIQGLIEQILTELLDEPILVIASGRTDAGVHAISQVANFHSKKLSDVSVLQEKLKERLPEDIRIFNMEEVESSFHSRYDAIQKTYIYRINTRERESVFTRKYSYPLNEQLHIREMQQAAAYLIGTHDFKAFCTDRKDGKSTTRTIYDIKISNINNQYGCSEVQIEITGDGFLYHMVRIIVGSLIEVGTLRRNPLSVKEALDSMDRSKSGAKIDSRGLFLKNVLY